MPTGVHHLYTPEEKERREGVKNLLDRILTHKLVRPVRFGIKPNLRTVYGVPPNPSITPSDSKPIVKAPRFRPKPLKYMLDNGLTRDDL